ncbi:MAG TPA: XdhC family protein [Candidatus Limnocylindrales bacterium]|nr:XdhC family protein [Candidatus Limnocylindrales bacterium]
MSGGDGFFARAATHSSRREPFATATVVRAERPTSAKPGAKAIVTREGALHGWIGGSCAAPTVVREALAALTDGEPRLISLASGPQTPREGVRHFAMTCHSGGMLEIYIEPVLPTEMLVVVGRAPVARALVALGAALGRHVVVADPAASREEFPAAAAIVASLAEARADDRAAIVVATRGEYDEDAVREALATRARYVALVASRTRAGVLVEALAAAGLPRDDLERLRYPAGLDIGARNEEEIALSILAEIVQLRPRAAAAQPETAIDPICGMTVAITADALRADHEGRAYYFCATGCLRRFVRDPAAALAERA